MRYKVQLATLPRLLAAKEYHLGGQGAEAYQAGFTAQLLTVCRNTSKTRGYDGFTIQSSAHVPTHFELI